MATAVPEGGPDPTYEERRFEEMIEKAKTEIRAKFTELIAGLRAREADLLTELEAAAVYYRTQAGECQGRKMELEDMRNQNKSNLNYPELRTMQMEFMQNIESKIRELEQQLLSTSIHFDWDESILAQVPNLGKVQLLDSFTLAPKVEYRDKGHPSIRRCRVGPNDGELDSPRVICVDSRSGHLFVSEKRNNRVQRFDRNGEYVSTLGSSAVRMETPDGLAIRDDTIYVSQFAGHHIQKYTILTGQYIGKIGERGRRKGELEGPTGLSINKRNNYLYVCERGNSRVQVFDQDSNFDCIFGSTGLECPIDIKLTSEEIFVLDESNPSIHVFNFEHQILRSLISNGIGKQTEDPYCLCIDMERNIYLSDFKRNCVYIFDSNGKQIHQLGSKSSNLLSSPTGLALDLRGRVIVVDKSKHKGCLIFF